MGTHGIYSFTFPDDEDYAEGLTEDEWSLENANWLRPLFAARGIPCNEMHLHLSGRQSGGLALRQLRRLHLMISGLFPCKN